MVGRWDEAVEPAGRASPEDLAELFDRCADFAARGGKTRLSRDLADHAAAFRRGDTSAIDRTDALFASNGPLDMAARADGWEEEYVGLAAAYRVEAASLKG